MWLATTQVYEDMDIFTPMTHIPVRTWAKFSGSKGPSPPLLQLCQLQRSFGAATPFDMG